MHCSRDEAPSSPQGARLAVGGARRRSGQRLSRELGAATTSPSGAIPFRNLNRSLSVERIRVVFLAMMDLALVSQKNSLINIISRRMLG